MLGPTRSRAADRPVLVSLDALVPKDNLYRQLDKTLDLSFVRDWVKDCYAERGRPSVDPIVFFKLLLVLYLEGLRSERQLMRLAADRLSVRWYVGYGLDETLPDHSTLTRIRERYGLEVFRRFFDAIVEQCVDAGLVWGKELYVDASQDGRSPADGFHAEVRAGMVTLPEARASRLRPAASSSRGSQPGTAYSARGSKRHHRTALQNAMQPIGAVALPPTPVCVTLPVGIDPNQEAVQVMRSSSQIEAAKARSRGNTPVEVDGAAGMDHVERGEDCRRRCAAASEDREAVIGL